MCVQLSREDLSVLSAGEQLSLRNTLQQQLLLAELAAMKYQNELYQAALQQAMDTLQRYFAAVGSDGQCSIRAISPTGCLACGFSCACCFAIQRCA